MKVIVGGQEFKSKDALTQECKRILNDDRVTGRSISSKELILIDDLLRMHPTCTQKVGKGGYEIIVRPCPEFPKYNQFYIRRVNGTGTTFSIYKCIKNISQKRVVS